MSSIGAGGISEGSRYLFAMDSNVMLAGGDPFAEVMFQSNANGQVCRSLARDALLNILQGEDDPSRDAKLGALLMGCAVIATPEVVAGFVDAVGEFEGRDLTTGKPSVSHSGERVVGCAGSGKKGRKTINISTASMLVAASAGAKALKAGSRSASSLTGSSDILEAVGFAIPQSVEDATSILDATNFGFYSIEDTVPRFNGVYGQRFFAPHVLSYALPALLIPVQVDSLLYGYAGPKVSLSAHALTTLGHSSVLVCNNTTDGTHFIDELATVGTTSLSGAQGGVVGPTTQFDAVRYLSLDGPQSPPDIDSCTTVAEQVELFLSLLNGELPGSIAESTVCLNAATMLYLAEKCNDPREGYSIAVEAIRTGKATSKLREVVAASWSING